MNSELALLRAGLQDMSNWLDTYPPNAARSPEAQLWSRCAKVGEEFGEVLEAIISATGQNPRKEGEPAKTLHDVVHELLDSAVAALGAVEHITGNSGQSVPLLCQHVRFIVTRGGFG